MFGAFLLGGIIPMDVPSQWMGRYIDSKSTGCLHTTARQMAIWIPRKPGVRISDTNCARIPNINTNARL